MGDKGEVEVAALALLGVKVNLVVLLLVEKLNDVELALGLVEVGALVACLAHVDLIVEVVAHDLTTLAAVGLKDKDLAKELLWALALGGDGRGRGNKRCKNSEDGNLHHGFGWLVGWLAGGRRTKKKSKWKMDNDSH